MEKVKAVMNWLLKPGSEARDETQHQDFAPSGTDTNNAVSILVANLDGREGASASNRVERILSQVSGTAVSRINRSLAISSRAAPIEGLLNAAKKGRRWLIKEQASILVWGSIESDGQAIKLRFLPLNGAPEGRPGAIGVGDELNLPINYTTEVDNIIVATTLCASNSTRVGTHQEFINKLHEYALRIEPLGAIEIPGLNQVQLISALQSIANVVATDARGDLAGLKKALEIYLRAIRLIPTDLFDNIRQALLHSQYAAALMAVGARDKNPEPNEQAVEAYKTVIATLGRMDHPDDWALSQIRLGLATYHMARKSEKPKIMADAIKALEFSLTVFDRTTHAGRWAEVKNHIGVVMTSMGEELADNTMLERAIEAFDDSLDVRKREQVLVLWAQTTNNMGAAAFALAKRTKDMELMQQAAYAFEGAIEAYRENGQENRAHIIEKNLKRAQAYLSGKS